MPVVFCSITWLLIDKPKPLWAAGVRRPESREIVHVFAKPVVPSSRLPVLVRNIVSQSTRNPIPNANANTVTDLFTGWRRHCVVALPRLLNIWSIGLQSHYGTRRGGASHNGWFLHTLFVQVPRPCC